MNESGIVRSICELPEIAAESPKAEAGCLEIAFVNNMPSAAFETAERQFRTRLLDAAGGRIPVHLSLFAFPEIEHTEAARRRIARCYSNIEELWNGQFDGLIVTGAEPRKSNLIEETYWEPMARLIDWAGRNTSSAIWSCLAAHAAVLHLDGIARRPLVKKRSGVFECAKRSPHSLMASIPPQFHMPHSRWNEIPEEALAAHGYSILSGSEEAGVDSFAKDGHGNSLFIFFQGHPEYESETLLLEYRRDVGRFLRGEHGHYPSMPCGYFDQEAVEMLTALRERALSDRGAEKSAEFPTAALANGVQNNWAAVAIGMYRNWLLYLCSQKALGHTADEARSHARVKGAGQAA